MGEITKNDANFYLWFVLVFGEVCRIILNEYWHMFILFTLNALNFPTDEKYTLVSYRVTQMSVLKRQKKDQ